MSPKRDYEKSGPRLDRAEGSGFFGEPAGDACLSPNELGRVCGADPKKPLTREFRFTEPVKGSLFFVS